MSGAKRPTELDISVRIEAVTIHSTLGQLVWVTAWGSAREPTRYHCAWDPTGIRRCPELRWACLADALCGREIVTRERRPHFPVLGDLVSCRQCARRTNAFTDYDVLGADRLVVDWRA